MAALAPELLVLSDAGRFLGTEDRDAALFSCLDDRLDPGPLFPSLDPDPMFDCAFNGGEAATPPDPPWDLEPPNFFPALQVKAEPGSPPSPPIRTPTPPPLGVKLEPPPPATCAPPEPAPGLRVLKAEGPPPIQAGPPPIQPRPPQTILLQPAAIAVPASALLLPGLLCLPPPSQGPPPRAPPKPEAKAIVPAPALPPPGAPEVDAQALRRQRRLLRNREAASQSRQRRRAYVQGLEQRLRLALGDNERLRRENALLQRRLDGLLAQVSEPGSSPRRVLCLILLLLLTLNLGPIGRPQPPPSDPPPPAPPSRARRHLLGVPAHPQAPPKGPPRVGGPPPPGLSQEQEEAPPHRKLFSNTSVPVGLLSDCQSLNRSENLRLAHELSGWVRRHQLDRRKPGPPPRPPRGQFQVLPPRKLPTSNRLIPTAPPKPERPPPSPFPAAISRREDTFYVVSFRRDHLLLPAISHNKTSRPKMSLVLPAAAINESLSGRGGGLEAMMQVDCEVMDTRVVHVRPPPRARAPPSPPTRAFYLGGGG